MIKLLLILGGIYLVLKLLRRYVLPFLLKRVLENLNGQGQQGRSQKQQKPKGSVTIDQKAAQKKKIVDKSEGDYIDFTDLD